MVCVAYVTCVRGACVCVWYMWYVCVYMWCMYVYVVYVCGLCVQSGQEGGDSWLSGVCVCFLECVCVCVRACARACVCAVGAVPGQRGCRKGA